MDYRHLRNLIESFLLEAEKLGTLNRTYGVEFEMCFKREALEAYISNNPDVVGNAGRFLAGDSDEWNTVLTHEGFGNWEHHYDGSVKGDYNQESGYRDPGIELVTPILSGAEGLQEISSFIRTFTTKLGGYVNKTCGGHVHIGAGDLLEGTQKQVANRFILGLLTAKKFKPLLDALVPKERRDSEWARDVNVSSWDAAKTLKNTRDDPANKWYARDLVDMFASDRYRSINFQALRAKGTIEFRIFDGSLDYATIEQRIRFGTAFVNLLATAEIDLSKNIKDSLKTLDSATAKGPRTKETKELLREIIKLNLMQKKNLLDALQYVTSRAGTSSMKIGHDIMAAVLKYPLYSKPVNLLDHQIIIDFRTSTNLAKAESFLGYSVGFKTSNTSIIISPTENKSDYSESMDKLIGEWSSDIGSQGITPEEFLDRLDVSEAEPYKVSLSRYGQEAQTQEPKKPDDNSDIFF